MHVIIIAMCPPLPWAIYAALILEQPNVQAVLLWFAATLHHQHVGILLPACAHLALHGSFMWEVALIEGA